MNEKQLKYKRYSAWLLSAFVYEYENCECVMCVAVVWNSVTGWRRNSKTSLISIIWSYLSTKSESMGDSSSHHFSHINKNSNGFSQAVVRNISWTSFVRWMRRWSVTHMLIVAVKVVHSASINVTYLWHIFQIWVLFLYRFGRRDDARDSLKI